ncbi:shadow of prion protein 2 [Sardina pilchardus]|uniref:shadow of prion protein 2 n=1 Tax=Sardina pilchardus TaxID=27697 RepID=UPI002E0E8362
MLGRSKLPLLWACLLLTATLCPSVQGKRGGGGGFRGRGKGVGMGSKVPSSQSGGSSKQGLKMAGAAAAGAIGGAAIGYGLGSLGKNRYGHGYGHGQGHGYGNGYGEDRRGYYQEGPGFNQSSYRYHKGAAAGGPVASVLTVLVPLVPLVLAQWAGVV